MAEISNQQREITLQMDVSRSARNFADEIEEFIPALRRYCNNILGGELSTDEEETLHKILPAWNTFLQLAPGVQWGTSAIIYSNINKDINMFIPRLEEQEGAQWTEDNKKLIKRWFPRWNMFLQARAGETLVTGCNLCLTIVGFIFYLVDLVSDIGAVIFFASNRQWWQALVTLAIVYTGVIIQTVVKWTERRIHCSGAADRLRYLAAMLVNWPDVKQYWEFCRLEWQLHRSPVQNARLVPQWDQRRRNIIFLKYMEGMCEACPQAILQLGLLLPDLYGAWTSTDYLRIAGAFISLCTAGAALVNLEKFDRLNSSKYLAPGELVVLYVWAVPVTGSRLLSVALFLTLYPYWFLGGVAVHLSLHVVFCCSTTGHSSALNTVVVMCLDTLQFLISSFAVTDSIKYRHVYHAIHLLVNIAMMVAWTLGTPLMRAHPALYAAIICVNAVMFVMGLVGWQVHEKLWPNMLSQA